MTSTLTFTRRGAVGAMLAVSALGLAGCGRAAKQPGADMPQSGGTPASDLLVPAASNPNNAMTVYRDPGCGCCEEWARLAREAGFEVTLTERDDMQALKQRLGVPAQLASCHTAVVGNYLVEGHVPLKDVKTLLRQQPANVKGLAVPGMPRGAPGMEMPDGATDPFQVMAFDRSGKASVFRAPPA